jgi:hypothetical protein
MKLDMRTVGLAIVGCTLGASGAFLYLTQSPFFSAFGQIAHLSGGTVAMTQCSPGDVQKDQSDEIFFVSCGGIY